MTKPRAVIAGLACLMVGQLTVPPSTIAADLCIGIDAVPFASFTGKRNRFEYSAFIGGNQVYTGELGIMLNYLVMTPNAQTGDGVLNKGRYSNPTLDSLLNRATGTIDDASLLQLLQQASRLTLDDFAVLPLYVPANRTATLADLVCEPRVDAGVPAMSIRSKY